MKVKVTVFYGPVEAGHMRIEEYDDGLETFIGAEGSVISIMEHLRVYERFPIVCTRIVIEMVQEEPSIWHLAYQWNLCYNIGTIKGVNTTMGLTKKQAEDLKWALELLKVYIHEERGVSSPAEDVVLIKQQDRVSDLEVSLDLLKSL